MALDRFWNRLKSTFFRVCLPQSPTGRLARLEQHCRMACHAKNQGLFARAEQQLDQALQVLEAPWSHDPLLAASLALLGETLEDFGKYTQAEKYYREALCVKENLLGRDHPDLAIELNNLGLIRYEQGRNGPAQEIYSRLLRLLEKNYSSEKRQLAICLENYAAVLRRVGEDQKSSQLLSRAKSIRNEIILERDSN